MEALNSVQSLLVHLQGAVQIDGDQVTVTDEAVLQEKIETVVYTAVFSEGLVRDLARWLVWEASLALGIFPSSIHELYMAVGSGNVPANFTVPAINVRALNFYMSRAIFRAANACQAGAILFEIARSEMGYTSQRPAEFVTNVLAAAIKEGYRGPVFIQGDHIQISASRYGTDADSEVQAVKDLIHEAVAAGYYNIDIDTSTLVDLSYPTLDEQQNANYTLCAAITEYVRSIEPEGITISLGGEIGEVGHKNSTVAELHAFMEGYNREVNGRFAGISKISVQTGTSHGGVVLPDGTLADVSVDFDTLRDLSATARDSYGLGGAVQHGASTLPATAFGKFPEVGTLEIHLATNFMNIIYDLLPDALEAKAYAYIEANNGDEWKEEQTRDQFIYKTRKKAIGPFKKAWWDMGDAKIAEISDALQEQFAFLFDKLNVKNTRDAVNRVTTVVKVHQPRPQEAVAEVAAEDVSDLDD